MRRETRAPVKPRTPVKPTPKRGPDPDKHPEWDPRRQCPDQKTRTVQPNQPP